MSIYGGIISVGGGGGGGGPTADWEAVSNVGGEALLTGTQFIGITNSAMTAGGLKLKEATGQLGTNPMVRFLDQAGGENAWLKAGGQHSVGFGFEAARGAGTSGASPGGTQRITAVGHRAGRAMTASLSDSTFIGYDAGQLATGIDNTFIGAKAGQAVTTGARNTFLGADAGTAQTSADDNVFIGERAGASVTTGLANVFIGAAAGRTTNETNGVFIGYQAGELSFAGAGANVFIGYQSGSRNTTGATNTYVGAASGANATTAGRNTFLGYATGNANTTAFDNTYIGYRSGIVATTGFGNTMVGADSGLACTTGGNNTYIGWRAGSTATTLSKNVFVGADAGLSSYASNSVFVGYRAGEAGTSSVVDTVIVGYQAGLVLTTAAGNTLVGASSGAAITAGGDNTALGKNSLLVLSTGVSNVAIGRASGQGMTTGSYNCLLGQSTFLANTTGLHNIGIGHAAGSGSTTGGHNILIGYQAGDNLTTGSDNIVIGYNLDAPTATSANMMTIGNLIFGTAIDGTGTTISTGNIGIGIVTPLYKFDVAGTCRVAVPDATADAFSLIEGANTYLALSTSNGTETMQFGNATTNPVFNFSGTGVATHTGLVDFDAGFKMATTKEGQWYNTADETTNYERGFQRWSTNVWQIGTETAGSGTQRALHLMYGATAAMQITATRPTFPQGITCSGNSLFTNNIELNFGNVESALVWQTAGDDHLVLGVTVGTATGSGNIVICEYADRATDFLHAPVPDPHVFIHSADALTTTDWLGLWCDQAGDGHVEVGGNGLTLGSSGKKMGFFGAAPSTQATGWSATNYTTDRTIDIGGEWSTITLGNVVATLINDLKAIGLIGA